MNNKLLILIRCGIGDALSYLARLPNILNDYKDHEVHFFVGGHGKTPKFICDILNLDPNVSLACPIKNFDHPSFDGIIVDYLNKIKGDNDSVLNLIPDSAPLKWNMKLPYEYNIDEDSINKANKFIEENNLNKFVCIHPVTTAGNAEGFKHDESLGRFWSKDKWKKLTKLLLDDGYQVVLTGLETESYNLEEIEHKNLIKGHIPILPTIELIKRSKGVISCNSWDWNISSRLYIPTICFYLTNQFFIKNHTSVMNKKFWKTCHIVPDHNINSNEIFNIFKNMDD